MKPKFAILSVCVLLFSMVSTACGYDEEKIPKNPPSINEPIPTDEISSNPFIPGQGGYAYYRIPALVVCKSGALLAFAEGRKNGSGDSGDIDVVVRRSTDGGKTWGKQTVIWDDGGNTCGNPTPVVLESGKVILVMCWNSAAVSSMRSVYTTSSDDEGATWAAARDITSSLKEPGDTWYATGPCHAIVKEFAPNKGRIVVPANRSCTTYPNGENHSHIIYSDDQGQSWHRGGFSGFKSGNETTVAELGNGDLMINMRNGDKTNYYRADAISKDGGATFLPHRMTRLIEPITGCQGSIMRYAVDEATNATTLIFTNPSHSESRRHGTLKLSTDDGNTWTKQYRYVSADGEGMYTSYSDIAVVAPQTIGVLYEGGYKYGWGILFQTVNFSKIKDPIK